MTTLATLVTTNCAECGVSFGIPSWFYKDRQADGKTFYCPNGHSLVYRESDVQRLERLLAEQTQATIREKSRRVAAEDQAEAAERSKRSYKGKLTQAKKKIERVEKGVCPHCKRYFANVNRHMTSKHSEVPAPTPKST